jgi:lipoprotein-anchoring transpeptidase ErfK/SrfK
MWKKSLGIAVVAAAMSSASAHAKVVIDIDIATQTMHVESATGSFEWPVSTARAGFSTPRGEFTPIGLERMHYSKKYHNSPMPYSIFFRGGYAIHGTYAVSALGTPASHGCVRLSPAHAKMLYEMVRNEGASISIRGSASRYASR